MKTKAIANRHRVKQTVAKTKTRLRRRNRKAMGEMEMIRKMAWMKRKTRTNTKR